MGQDRNFKVGQLRDQVERGDYRIDPGAVADAIVGRLRDLVQAGGNRMQGQSECSYPDSSSTESTNSRPAGPSTTDPIHVRPTFAPGAPAVSWLSLALGGTQKQIS
jgi:Anti-sigma-28 factor, FlgM